MNAEGRRLGFCRCCRSWGLYLALIGVAVASFCMSSCTRKPPVTRWTMIDVSPGQMQADCHLIEFPDGERVLIDVADAMDAPGTALAFLKKHEIKHVNLVIISHFHKDHYGRLVDIIKAGIKVDRVAISLPANRKRMDYEHKFTPLADWDDAMATLRFLREKHIPYFMPKIGERLIDASTQGIPIHLDVVCRYDGVHTPIGETSINDTSIIVRLTHGKMHALFTGDLTSQLARWLADSNLNITADLLKVQHHGDDWSGPDKFFARVNPKAALVPAPKSLWLSDRDKMVRNYFSSHRIPVYVAGINGNVVVTFTAEGYTIWSEHPTK